MVTELRKLYPSAHSTCASYPFPKVSFLGEAGLVYTLLPPNLFPPPLINSKSLLAIVQQPWPLGNKGTEYQTPLLVGY